MVARNVKDKEELLEEITRHIYKTIVPYAKWKADGVLKWTDEQVARVLAEELITRILQAAARGDVKLPGEVGRLPFSRQMAYVLGWNMRVKEEATEFIALSPREEE